MEDSRVFTLIGSVIYKIEIKRYFKKCHTILKNNNILIKHIDIIVWGFPHSSVSKEFAMSVGDLGLIPGSGRSPGKGNGYPHQYSCLENSMDKGAWWAVAELDATE